MTRYLLDTNIISNFTKLEPSASLIAWMAEQPHDDAGRKIKGAPPENI